MRKISLGTASIFILLQFVNERKYICCEYVLKFAIPFIHLVSTTFKWGGGGVAELISEGEVKF